MPETFTAPRPPEKTQPEDQPIESKRELIYMISRLGSRAGIGVIRRLNATDTSVWPDPQHKDAS